MRTTPAALNEQAQTRTASKLIRDASICRLAVAGLTGAVIASRVGCSLTVVYRVARGAGVPVGG